MNSISQNKEGFPISTSNLLSFCNSDFIRYSLHFKLDDFYLYTCVDIHVYKWKPSNLERSEYICACMGLGGMDTYK